MEITSKELQKKVITRPDCTSDQYVCQQVCGEYKKLPIKDRIVFDLGANIGAFTAYAVMKGAAQVISYEPLNENFEMLTANAAQYHNVILNHGAISTLENEFVDLYIGMFAAKDGAKIIPTKGRDVQKTKNFNFASELELYKPSVIKMDVECAEFALLATPLPEYVKDLVVEIHFSKKEFRQGFNSLVKMFDDWQCIIEPKQTGTNFHTLGQWHRD